MDIRDILRANPLVLAPMAGITDLPFRVICRELGAGLAFSEMLSVEALVREHKRTQTMLRSNRADRPVVFQLFGAKPESVAEAARIVSKGEIDFIDINMGCPVPKIVKSGAGSALLRDLGLAKEILSAAVSSSRVPVTVKIRIGWDSRNIVAVDFARAAESAGIAAVTVHGRTKTQGFSGRADWSTIRAVKDSIGIPVIGNGDIRSARDAKRMLVETHCDGVMIGRAVQGNPWIFREAGQYLETGIVPPPPALEERRTLMLRHLNEVLALIDEAIGVLEMRKHLCWYAKGLPGGADFRTIINRLITAEEVQNEVHRYFDKLLTAQRQPIHAP